MAQFISTNDLENISEFLDNVYICGAYQENYDRRSKKVKKAARQHKFTFNEKKSVLSPTKFQRLGLLVENSNIKPHPKHLQTLHDLPSRHNSKLMKKKLGLFFHYSK